VPNAYRGRLSGTSAEILFAVAKSEKNQAGLSSV